MMCGLKDCHRNFFIRSNVMAHVILSVGSTFYQLNAMVYKFSKNLGTIDGKHFSV
jgi:hypothetical protein